MRGFSQISKCSSGQVYCLGTNLDVTTTALGATQFVIVGYKFSASWCAEESRDHDLFTCVSTVHAGHCFVIRRYPELSSLLTGR